ncbi:MAG: hypothetical protein R3345_05615 [Fulvivirga sp.]|nr:hypothetical protein [Fulvivirga sp.]
MNFIAFASTRKHQHVIKTVRAYFNGEITTIPYSASQIKKTIYWLEKEKSGTPLLTEKLQMAATLCN